MVLAQLFAIVFAAAGVAVGVSGARRLRTVYHILTNDPVPVRDLHGHAGPVEVEGTARTDEDGGTVTAPFTGSECLAYTYEVEELRSSGKHSNWTTLDEGADGLPFVLADDTGRVRVDPTGADLRFADHTVTVSPGTELPERLAAYVDSTEAVDPQDDTVDLVVTELNVGNEQRFTERRLDVGESVYVYGQAEPGGPSGWGTDLVDATVGDGPDAPAFVVSDTDERGTAWRFARGGLLRLGMALLFVGFTVPIFLETVAF